MRIIDLPTDYPTNKPGGTIRGVICVMYLCAFIGFISWLDPKTDIKNEFPEAMSVCPDQKSKVIHV